MAAIKDKLSQTPPSKMKAIVGKLADAESMVALKDLMNKLGCENIVHDGGFEDLCADLRSSYVTNSTVRGVDEADVILLIGTDPRKECPVLNARIRKAVLNGARVGGMEFIFILQCLHNAPVYLVIHVAEQSAYLHISSGGFCWITSGSNLQI